jgi:hypothetical protein
LVFIKNRKLNSTFTQTQNTEAFAHFLSSLAALLPTEPLEEEAGKGGASASKGGASSKAAPTVTAAPASKAKSAS